MGSTVLTNKSAAAFRNPANGKVIYALFEQTYEKNCTPHTPDWGCFAFGEYADVMGRVFLGGSCCEGGSLQSRAGLIKPENYIEAWKRALAKAVTLDNNFVSTSMNDEQLELAKKALMRAGLEDQIARLGGDYTFRLHDDADILLALYGVKGPFSPWKILDHRNGRTLSDTSLAPAANGYPGKAKVEAPTIMAYKLDNENRLVKIGDAPFHHAGWQYSAVGAFITDVAYGLEMQCAGSAKKIIPAFRDTLNAAPELPVGVRIAIRRITEGSSNYSIRETEKLAKIAGARADAERFVCDLSALAHSKSQHALRALAKNQVEWIMPKPADFRRAHGCYF